MAKQKMEAGIELLPMIRECNASMQLYVKLWNWLNNIILDPRKYQTPSPGKCDQLFVFSLQIGLSEAMPISLQAVFF